MGKMCVCTPGGIQNLGGADALKQEIAALKQELSSLKTTVDTLKQTVNTLKQTVNTQGTTINSLKETIGNTSISGIGGGTLTGAIKAVDSNAGKALKANYGAYTLYTSGTVISVTMALLTAGYINGTFVAQNLADLPTQNWGYVIRFSRIEANLYLLERYKAYDAGVDYNILRTSTGTYSWTSWKRADWK